MRRNSRNLVGRGAIAAFAGLSFIVAPAIHAQTRAVTEYRFNGMWPTLADNYYFASPWGLAADGNGHVYVTDAWQRRVRKFSSVGNEISNWPVQGAWDVAVDSRGRVYVAADSSIDVYDGEGHLVSAITNGGTMLNVQWVWVDSRDWVYASGFNQTLGTNTLEVFAPDDNAANSFAWLKRGPFESITGMAETPDRVMQVLHYDSMDAVYVVSLWDPVANTILDSWPITLTNPADIAVDDEEFAYISDPSAGTVTKVDPAGDPVKSASMETGLYPSGKLLNAGKRLFMISGTRLQQFSQNLEVRTIWGSAGAQGGWFYDPGAVHATSAAVFVADRGNARVQKFDLAGNLQGTIDRWGTSPGTPFSLVTDVCVDGSGNVYVLDDRTVHQFDGSGTFLRTLAVSADAISARGTSGVYVADMFELAVKKVSDTGVVLATWNIPLFARGASSVGFTVDSAEFVYISLSDAVIRYDPPTGDGDLVQTNSYPVGNPVGLSVDGSGQLFVTETIGITDAVVRVIDTSTGTETAQIGQKGYGPDQFLSPEGVSVNPDGILFVVDEEANRVQRFDAVTISTDARAIICAGGGPYPNGAKNTLWPHTQFAANEAYRTLRRRGFTKDRIEYLSADDTFDQDGNNTADDIDAKATNANLKSAIMNAANSEDVIIYLVNHGGNGNFLMSGSEILRATDSAPGAGDGLAGWIDAIAPTISGKIVIVYDACRSGSFMSALAASGRLVITSAQGDENAVFRAQGALSFSNFFWDQIDNGQDVWSAFTTARDAMARDQNGQLDADGDGIANEAADATLAGQAFIGQSAINGTAGPTVGTAGAAAPGDASNTPITDLTGSTVKLFADSITSNRPVTRVWAELRPPNFVFPSDREAVLQFDTVDLEPVGGGVYEVETDKLNADGTYTVLVYAKDEAGKISLPKIVDLGVNASLRHKAVIFVGGDATDPNWAGYQQAAIAAWEGLKSQQYSTTDDIRFLSSTTFHAGINGSATLATLEDAITNFGTTEAKDLAVFIVGNGTTDQIHLANGEVLQATTLKTWLDQVQNGIPGSVYVVLEACRSGSFLDDIKPPVGKNRVNIASAQPTEPAHFLFNGAGSFSQYFWRRILKGASIGDAFSHAARALKSVGKGQQPAIDDDGSGGTTKADGALARRSWLGTPVVFGADDPIINADTGDKQLAGTSSTAIGISQVVTTGTIAKAWAAVVPPNFSAGALCAEGSAVPVYDLEAKPDGSYELTVPFYEQGVHKVAAYVQDSEGDISLPAEFTVEQTSSAFTDGATASDLRNNFATLDADDSQGLSFAEAQTLIAGLTSTVFNNIDGNADGELSLAELLEVSVGPVGMLEPVYVDFSYTKTEAGTNSAPFNTLAEGAAFVLPGGTVYLEGGSSGETLTITRSMTITTTGGSAIIGAP